MAQQNGALEQTASAEVQKEETTASLTEAPEERAAKSNGEPAIEPAGRELSADMLTEIAAFEQLAGSGEADKLRALMRAAELFEANPSG